MDNPRGRSTSEAIEPENLEIELTDSMEYGNYGIAPTAVYLEEMVPTTATCSIAMTFMAYAQPVFTTGIMAITLGLACRLARIIGQIPAHQRSAPVSTIQ